VREERVAPTLRRTTRVRYFRRPSSLVLPAAVGHRQIQKMLTRIANKALELMGLAVFRRERDFVYVPRYFGRAAHKHTDIRTLSGFGELARVVIQQRRTKLDYDRLYTIYQAIEHVSNLPRDAEGFANLVEVGVFKGGTSYFMAAAARELGVEPVRMHSFDTFEGHAAEDLRDNLDASHQVGQFNDTSFESVKQYLQPLSVRVHKGRFQETSSELASLAIHFAHLDVDLYEPTLFALRFLESRLVTGGTVIVDDYGFKTCPGASKAVEEFLRSSTGFFSLRLLTGQCVLVRYRGDEVRAAR
jgi:O-methyltransferase